MARTRPLPLALALWAALHGGAEAATVQHSETLRAYRLVGAVEKPHAAQPTTLQFNAFSRDFVLELEPNGRLARMQQRLALDAGTGAYRGRLAGRPGSWARLVLTPAGPTGLVFDGETLYGLEAGADKSAGAAGGGSAVMFRLADVYFAPGEIGGELDAVAIDGERAVAAVTQQLAAVAAAGATLNLDVGAVADFEFSQAFGVLAETALLTRFNNIDGIFSEQLGVQISVAEIDIFTTSNDPFTTSAASELLEELANYRGATPAQDAQGLTHLFTGRDLDGSTAGTAYFGAVCARRGAFDTRSFGAGLSEARRGAVTDSLIAAHEIGHNFGAPHDGDAAGPCASTPTTFLMAPSVNGSDQFSACSLEQMQAEIAGATCLTPIGPANVAVTLPQPAQALAGEPFVYTATVRNDGADAATGVTFTAATEQGLDVVAVDAAGASCTVGSNTASCALGAVSGGAARAVTLTLRAAAAGSFDLTGSVAADADADATDNADAVTVTAVPAVDLVLTGATGGIELDAQTTITATLANAADVEATSVSVTARSSAGLRADQATLGGASCTVTPQTITCPSRSLAGRGTVALVVTATGTAAGAQQLTISAAAAEAERTPADNQLAIPISVNAPLESNGGGGGVSWWLVALLLAACAAQRRAASGRRRPSEPTPSGA
jgi:uncharacterized repeat protein (TIGR01451 family)